jgi:hypothetical protein
MRDAPRLGFPPAGLGVRLAVRCRLANGKVECMPSSFGLAVLHASFCKDGKTQGAWTHTQGRQRDDKPREQRAGRRHHTASEELPNAENTSEGEAAHTDEMAVDAGQETSKAKQRSQQRLASHGKAMGFLKGLVFKRWIGAVQQEKQQREQQRRAEAAAGAEAAAAAAAQAARERELGALRRELDGVRKALSSTRAREAALITHTGQLEDQLRWQWSPGQSDEREPRRPRTSHAAAEERWPPEAACETTGAKGQGNGRSNTSGYHGRGYDLRHRGYG